MLDVKKWLMEDMGFSAEEAEKMAPSFAGDRATKLEAGYVGPNEKASIAAARTEVETRAQALQQKEENLNRDILEFAGMTDAEKARNTTLQESLHAREQELLSMRQTLTTVAERAGIDPATVLPKEPVIKREEPKVPAIDTTQFVSADSFSRMSGFLADAAAAMPYIAAQHFDLTGQHLDPRTVMAEIKKRAANKNAVVDPVAVWEEMHGITAKREAKAAEARQAEITAAEQRGEERARTAMSIPGADGTSHSRRPSPVLHPVRGNDGQMHARQAVLKRPSANDTVMRAAAALRAGKHARTA